MITWFRKLMIRWKLRRVRKQIAQAATMEGTNTDMAALLARAEQRAEKAAPLARFQDGALMKDRTGKLYRMSNVAKKGWHVNMTIEGIGPKRPAGMSARQWDRMQKAQKRLARERAARRVEA